MPVKKETVQAKLFNDDKAKVKLVYKLDEASRMTGVDAATLASWEEEFPFLNAGLTGSGEKFFRQQDVAAQIRHEGHFLWPSGRLSGRTRQRGFP